MKANNAYIKLVASLDTVQGRRREGLFKVEGTKAVLDTLGAFSLDALLATPEWIDAHPLPPGVEPVAVAARQLQRASSLKTPQGVIAVCRIPQSQPPAPAPGPDEVVVALDALRDPGNLGTIMRTADWYGITRIVASADTVDCYSPKVVQATMGALARVSVEYVPDLAAWLRRSLLPVVGTFMTGSSIYADPLPRSCVLVIGNEGAGISPAVADAVTCRVTIPSWPPGRPTSESLNAATAAAIAISALRAPLMRP